jgi:hypothetical protein
MSDLESPNCPKCGSTDLSVERRPNGDAICNKCNWHGPYADCFQKAFNQIREREKQVLAYHGFDSPAAQQAASFAFKEFLEAEARRTKDKTFWDSPLGRKAFMLGDCYGCRA